MPHFNWYREAFKNHVYSQSQGVLPLFDSFEEELGQHGITVLAPGYLQYKSKRFRWKGDADSLIAKFNGVIISLQTDANTIATIIHNAGKLDAELRSRDTMQLSPELKEQYKHRILSWVDGMKLELMKDKNRQDIVTKISEIAETIMVNPTWIMMKLQTLDVSLRKFMARINNIIKFFEKRRNLLIGGVKSGELQAHYPKQLKKRTAGYNVYPISDYVYRVEKPDGTIYSVNALTRKCNCPAGLRSTPCKHLSLVDDYINREE